MMTPDNQSVRSWTVWSSYHSVAQQITYQSFQLINLCVTRLSIERQYVDQVEEEFHNHVPRISTSSSSPELAPMTWW